MKKIYEIGIKAFALNGIIGKLLRVDLTKEKVEIDNLSEADARKYMGGLGLGSKILFEELKPGIDPLGSDNKLLFMVGPLTGSPCPGNSRVTIMAKSPLTSLLGYSNSGGFFPSEIKFSGFDGIIVEGISKKPVYLWVHDGEADIRCAEHLWGKTTFETAEIVKDETDNGSRVATIGIGGENKVKYACIMNDHVHAAGRTGMGAIMGSKNLKAVAVYGEKKSINIYNREGMIELSKDIVGKLLPRLQNLIKYGSAPGVRAASMGYGPTKNWQMGIFDKVDDLDPKKILSSERGEPCFACPISCHHKSTVNTGPYAMEYPDGPEYETMMSFGPLCLNNNLESIVHMNYLCNAYSIDVINTGAILAYLMECRDRGLITKDYTDGIDLTWGNHKEMIQMIHKIGKREGIGDTLAKDLKKIVEKTGKITEDFIIEVKGMAGPVGHEPRAKIGMGLMWATSNRGACHLSAGDETSYLKQGNTPEIGLIKSLDRFSTEGKAGVIKKTMDLMALMNSMTLCRWTSFSCYRPVTITDLVNQINLVTGWEMGIREFMTLGERITNLGRAFNVREGITRKDDTLPKRFHEPLISPKTIYDGKKLSREDLDIMLDEFYGLQGWDKKTGVPTAGKLKEIGLNFVNDELKSLGFQAS